MTVVGGNRGKTAANGAGQLGPVDIPKRSTCADTQKPSVPRIGCRQPYFDADMGSRYWGCQYFQATEWHVGDNRPHRTHRARVEGWIRKRGRDDLCLSQTETLEIRALTRSRHRLASPL